MGSTAAGKRIMFPAQAVLELPDTGYEAHMGFIEAHVAKGNLEFLKRPVLSKEEQAKADEALEASLRKQMAELQARKESKGKDSK